MSEIKTVSAELNIEVNVTCPNDDCGEVVNILNELDTNGFNHNDEGQIIKQALPDGLWMDAHQNFSVSDVTCTHCETNFNVRGMMW